MNPSTPCAFCQCPLSLHCKGNLAHSDHKEEARMVELKWRRGTSICKTRHCLTPLCCCVDFQEPKDAA